MPKAKKPAKQPSKKPPKDGAVDVTTGSHDATNSKAITVSTKPIVQDPMVRPQPSSVSSAPEISQSGSTEETKTQINPYKSHVTLTPTDEKEKDEKPEDTTLEDEKPAQETDAPEAKNAKDAQETKPSTSEPSKTSEDSKSNNQDDDDAPPEDGLVNELAKQAADKKQQKEQDSKQASKRAELEKHIQNKTYFVKIGQITHRRNARILLTAVILMLLLGLVVLNFLIDAEMLDIGIEPLTNIIE